MVARHVTLISGNKTADLACLFSMLASIGDLEARAHGNHIGPSGELLIHLYHASMIATTFPRLVGQHAGTLDTLIRKFTAHRATDPRDKIYSLFGHSRALLQCYVGCRLYFTVARSVQNNH
jgi:hypothetical protein